MGCAGDYMNKNMYLLSIGLLVLLAACSTTQSTGNAMKETMIEDDSANEIDMVFELTGENFAFFMDGQEQPELRVKQGDTVKIIFTSTDGFHDWVVDEFDAATEKVQTGGTTEVTFVAREKGTFEYYCSVGQHRANGMWGNIIVE